MSADLDRLLGQTGAQPPSAADVEELWARGRRRRGIRHAVTAGSAALVLVVGGVGAAGLVANLGPGNVSPLASSPEPTQTTPPGGEDEEPVPAEPEVTEDVPAPDEPGSADDDAVGDGVEGDDGLGDEVVEDTAPAPDETAPTPDANRVADPCGPHAGREGEAFIDVVSPVPGMEVGADTKFIGCSNVYEATVLWRVVDGGGATLRDGFVTADCGSGCVGAFSELIDLAGLPAGAVLEVFWEDAADGSDRDLVRIPLA